MQFAIVENDWNALCKKQGVKTNSWGIPSFIAWTTTPWTLPANVAICLNENFDYGLYKTEKGNLILAKDLAESAFKDIGIENAELLKEFKGKELEYATYQHPS